MTPIDWARDKAIYEQWQQWSEKARHTLKQWKVTQKRQRFHIFTRNLMKLKKKASTLKAR